MDLYVSSYQIWSKSNKWFRKYKILNDFNANVDADANADTDASAGGSAIAFSGLRPGELKICLFQWDASHNSNVVCVSKYATTEPA